MNAEPKSAYICLGGNMGNAEKIFAESLARVGASAGVSVARRSSLFLTEPQGDHEQPWFSNQVVQLTCAATMTPQQLLGILLAVEDAMGRERLPDRRFGPRLIDIDLLLFDDTILTEKSLILPHPRMHLRAFVLVPLLELDPEINIPGQGAAIACLARLSYTQEKNLIYQPLA